MAAYAGLSNLPTVLERCQRTLCDFESLICRRGLCIFMIAFDGGSNKLVEADGNGPLHADVILSWAKSRHSASPGIAWRHVDSALLSAAAIECENNGADRGSGCEKFHDSFVNRFWGVSLVTIARDAEIAPNYWNNSLARIEIFSFVPPNEDSSAESKRYLELLVL